MFVNKWYNIQLRPDSVDRVWRSSEGGAGQNVTGLPSDPFVPGGGGGGPVGPNGPKTGGDDGGSTVIVQIPRYQTIEWIRKYEFSEGTNKDGYENLTIGFGFELAVDSKYVNCLNSYNTAGSGGFTYTYKSRDVIAVEYELRKITGDKTKPFDPQNYVKVATGKEKSSTYYNISSQTTYYIPPEWVSILQNLTLRATDSNNNIIKNGSIPFVDGYNGPERRFIIGKITKLDTTNDIIEFSLDDSEYYDKQKGVFKFDGIELSKQDFIDLYLIKRSWLTDNTIPWTNDYSISIEWFPTYMGHGNDGTAYIGTKSGLNTNLSLDNPEHGGKGSLYDATTNTLRLYRGSLNEYLPDTLPGLKLGDVIKIDIEPRLLENTYYYLTLINPNYSYYNGLNGNINGQPYYYKIGDNPTTSSTQCSPTQPPTRTTPDNSIDNSTNPNYYEQSNNNNYFAWFKTPEKWVPYVAPVVTPTEPPKPTYNHYDPKIRFGYSYETYNATTNPDNNGTVNGDQIDTQGLSYKVTLKGHFWLENLSFKPGTENKANNDISVNDLVYPGDLPSSLGFLVKKPGDTEYKFVDNYKLEIFDQNGVIQKTIEDKNFNEITYIKNLSFSQYTINLPTQLGGNGTIANRCINFSTSFIVGANIKWNYRIFVKRADANGTIFYADPYYAKTVIANSYYGTSTNYPSTISEDLLIKTAGITITDWIPPTKKDTGFWYQIYNSWKEVTTAPKRILPYLTVRIYDGIGFPTHETNQVDKSYPIHYYLNYVFNSDKNFQFRTIVENYYQDQNTIKPNITLKTPWGEDIVMLPPFIGLPQVPDELKRINIYSYSNINGYTNTINSNEEKPKKLISSKTNPQNPITYITSPNFGAQNGIIESGLCHVSVSENDWTIQGSAVWNVMTQTTNGQVDPDAPIIVPYFYYGRPYAGRGWHYLPKDGKFLWFDSLYAGTDINQCFPMGGNPNDYFSGKTSDIGYMSNNFISTYVPYQLFNLNFEYTNYSPSKIIMYMGGELPWKDGNLMTNIDELIEKGRVKKIGEMGNSVGEKQKCEFIGLVGNQYVFFVAEPILDFSKNINFNGSKTLINENPPSQGYKLSSGSYGIGTYSVIEISNFGVSGTYNNANNLLHQIKETGSYKTNITNAAYSIKLGVGNNVFSDSINSTILVSTKSGNGTIYSGIWENGVWNSGWRSDITTREFNSVGQYYSYDKDRTWRMSIVGREVSVNYFNVGDTVAISNVVAIDINDDRKLLKSHFRIISKTIDSIVVEFDTDFPVRRIEKDSSEHRILVTKNIWLNGVFLNGYFKGVWNNGLFSGFPMITKMDSSHWIDGIFNGGHFTAKKLRITSSGDNIAKSYKVDDKERLAISFTNNHNIEKDDVISMTYSTNFTNKGILGSTIVLDVPDSKTVVTGIGWRKELEEIKSITFITSISDGLVQNFEFHSNNVSTVTSLDTLISERVFSYNSWMDINYSNKSAINIGRPQTLLNEHDKAYSENNLYGYPSNDVLSSKSTFRDSYSRTVRNYRLGKKYKIYKDYVGESSGFENYFDPTDTTQGDLAFREQGWKWSKSQETIRKITTTSAEKNSNNKLSLKISIENPYVMSLTGSVTITGPVEIWINNTISTYDVLSFPTEIDNITKDVAEYIVNTKSTMFKTSGTGPSWAINTIPPDLKPSDTNFYISVTQSGSIKFSRTPEPSEQKIPGQGKELLVNALGNGGILYLKENKNIEGDDVDPVPKQRYTMVEFDLINYKGSVDGKGEYTDDIGTLPPIHFNNINRVFRKTTKGVVNLSATYLPIYKNVNHVATFGQKKQEFFFNKRNILMSFTGYGSLGGRYSEYMIDNLKLYEVDMVPFFQYFKNPFGKTGNINTSVQIPNTGLSPGLIESSDKVIDATTENEVVNLFVSKFVSFNTQIPAIVNWRRDYAVYGPQMLDSYTDPKLY